MAACCASVDALPADMVHLATLCNYRLLFSDKLAAGVYAVHVTGSLPEHVIDDLEANGIHYRPRDTME